jgi:hypothetical protein
MDHHDQVNVASRINTAPITSRSDWEDVATCLFVTAVLEGRPDGPTQPPVLAGFLQDAVESELDGLKPSSFEMFRRESGLLQGVGRRLRHTISENRRWKNRTLCRIPSASSGET